MQRTKTKNTEKDRGPGPGHGIRDGNAETLSVEKQGKTPTGKMGDSKSTEQWKMDWTSPPHAYLAGILGNSQSSRRQVRITALYRYIYAVLGKLLLKVTALPYFRYW
jgi:hypothetical protein